MDESRAAELAKRIREAVSRAMGTPAGERAVGTRAASERPEGPTPDAAGPVLDAIRRVRKASNVPNR
jgi:hypothetical protein